MNSEYGPVEVEVIGGLQAEDEIIKKAKVTFLGEPPNATARLYQWQVGQYRFKMIDTLTEVTVLPSGEDEVRITGVSEQLIEEVGLTHDDAFVTWAINISGCPTC